MVNERNWRSFSIAQFFNTYHIFSFSLISFVISVLLLCYLYEQCIYLTGPVTYTDVSFNDLNLGCSYILSDK